MKLDLFQLIRIFLLLLLLATVAFYTKIQKLKSRSWSEPLHIVVFPINSDDNPIVEDYIEQLEVSAFQAIDGFMQKQSRNYSIITSQPTQVHLGDIIKTKPPTPPASGTNFVAIAWWTLRFRYWAYWNTPGDDSYHHRVRIFVLYHETLPNRTLQHSLGLAKGLLAIVHAFASKSQEAQNNIVITHEFLHTVGATDKYDANGQPVYPEGYAVPEQSPLYPQQKAEIMGGYIPLSPHRSRMPASLSECIIGPETAKEINWSE